MNQDVRISEQEVIWGAANIGRAIGKPTRSAYHLLEQGAVAGARKIAGRWSLRRSVFLKSYESVG